MFIFILPFTVLEDIKEHEIKQNAENVENC